MAHPIPQTPEQLHRDVCRSIARAALDLARMARHESGQIDAQFDFLRHLVQRRDVIRTSMRPKRIEMYQAAGEDVRAAGRTPHPSAQAPTPSPQGEGF